LALYLGFDCSTQSLTTTVIEVEPGIRRVVLQQVLEFDRELAPYGTEHGVLHPDPDPRVVVAPPLMWVEALDLAMQRVAGALGPDLTRVRAISGSAQQHGSVYLNRAAPAALAALDWATPLAPQLRQVFSRAVAPVWMDSSTAKECDEITRALGGDAQVARLTGSRTFERFTGPQIRRFFETQPGAYLETSRIHLVSSFMASLLAGGDAPIDHGDASGMNLMDIRRRAWAPAALEATAPGLSGRLPLLIESRGALGPLARYWQQRYGFPPARLIAWSGDNPCSLIGTGLVREGRLAISLGTSDTVFGLMRAPNVDPSCAGSVFASPTGDYMGLTCFSNGSLARDQVRQRYRMTWDEFSDALRRTPVGNNGALMLPWFEPEITPRVARAAVRRRALGEDDGPANVRAVVEAQVMAMKRHSRWMGVSVDTIYATGGASANREILRVIADVFDATVYQFPVTNSAALGAALRAFHADAFATGEAITWEDAIAGFAEPLAESRISPTSESVLAYRDLARAHAAFEEAELRE
jgi:xylulokinase